MKTTWLMAGVLWVLACNGGSQPPLTGTYSRHSTDEFGHLWDTLLLQPLHDKGKQAYRVVRRTAIRQRKLDDTVWLPVQHKETAFTGIFDPSQHILRLEEEGLAYSVDPATRALVHGEVRYDKH